MMRVLEFTTAFGIGGTEGQFVELLERIDHAAFDLHVGCLKKWGQLLPRVEKLDVPLVEYPVSNLYRLDTWARRLALGSYLRRHRIDIVHSYGFYSNVFAIPAARAAGVPVVLASIRDTGADLTPLRRRVQKIVCRLADAILVNAQAVRDWLVEDGYPARKIQVILNGVDVARFVPAMGRGRLQRELGLPPTTPLVGVLSRLSPEKGIESFLEAAAEVSRLLPSVRFVVLGERLLPRQGRIYADWEYRESLAQDARRRGLEGRVFFTGFRTDVAEILPDITVSVLPSLTEGLSNTLLESMAAGRPVVATAVGGTPEAVDDGVTGLLVPAADPGALAQAISLLVRDVGLAARLGRAAHQSIMARFSMDKLVRETERLYETLAEATRTRAKTARHAELRPGRGTTP